ncbi:putative membrane copper amine oxidase [Aspergillus violaceofuscus CBS 115571]|uniref:Amine oxidase n=1 Tax=Aspergillus violaceofuscus (strain CBS 115571) TaxID=1450538 RepID=A0A2V5GZ98_ASPV1|nr:putative membrane copper amine oxidase [Aspergillus violaceofuscus CBS 115571]
MRLTISAAALPSLLLLPCLIGDALAHPRPDPKTAWVRQGRGRKSSPRDLQVRSSMSSSSCVDKIATVIRAPKHNVWEGLTDDETAFVVKWLFQQTDLNLTVTEDAGEWDNTITLVELMRPNKTDVLSYLDHQGPAPSRYAHVVLDNRATTDPHYADILVGPLPITNQSTPTWEPLEYPYTRKTHGRVRNLDADYSTIYSEWLYKISASIADITLDLFNGTALGLDNDTLDIWGIDPLWQDDSRIIRWDTFWNMPTYEFDTGSILPLGLFFKSDVTGRDPSQWKLEGRLYNDVFYETTEEFRNAFFSPGFVKLKPNVEGPWAQTDQRGPVLPQDKQQPPLMVAPSGARYSVDLDRKYVTWMDFSFYISFSRDTGVSVFDIRYKGQRVLYELGLQEALAHYAGNDPIQSSVAYLDSYYGFGPYAFELVKGYDCPVYATYLNSSFYVSETTHTHIDSLCVFEYDADYPIQRHSTSDYVSSTKNVYLTLRSVSTIGNYDYMTSYTFHMDGTIGVEVRASGYIQAAYYAHNEDFGYRIHDALSGSMHDHVLNFKADFDILGINNSIELTTVAPVTRNFTWSGGRSRNTMALERSILTSEDEGRFNWGPNGATMIHVINQEARNQYGEYRGYRVLPAAGTAHLTVQDSSNLAHAAHWAEYDIQVTQQHDHEPRAAHPYNSQDIYDPPVNFAEFFDGESLHQTDLVVWLNLGMHHVPHTGDLPNTVFTTAHSGVQFTPLNYLLGDPSRQTVNMVRVNYANGSATEVKTFGQAEEVCAVQLTGIEEELWRYQGDVVVRKFPYDPNDPYYEMEADA